MLLWDKRTNEKGGKEDRSYETRSSMKNAIVHLLGGRVAEALTLDDISTGASNDIMRATEVARDMVTKYGFSERLGTVNYSSSEEVFLGNDFTTHKNYSDEVAREIDEDTAAYAIAASPVNRPQTTYTITW